jgi:uncharacterized protein YdeI (YjbR/CyaY-like superfamily)
VKVTRTLYVHRVADWRRWLRTNHETRRGIWLVYHRKGSGKPRISYNDAIVRFAQRFTPRRPGSAVSEMNRTRARRLVREQRMTKAGARSRLSIGECVSPS